MALDFWMNAYLITLDDALSFFDTADYLHLVWDITSHGYGDT